MSVLDWPTGVTAHKPEKCCAGYTLFAPIHGPYVYLIDMDGEVVHIWPVNMSKDDAGEGTTIGTTWYYKYLPATQSLLVFVNGFGVKELDWEGNVLWEYRDRDAHHDFSRLENGNTLILSRNTAADLRDIADGPCYDDYFVEVAPDGHIVWEWHLPDHYEELGLSSEAKRHIRARGKDWAHTNTLEALPDGNIATCFRHLGIIAIVDRQTSDFTWMYDDLVGPHHPNMVENGNIIVYDNGGECGFDRGYPSKFRHYTRLLEIDPTTDEVVWEYTYSPPNWVRTHASSARNAYRQQFLSSAWGSIQRLANGNTFSLDATKGRLFEVTLESEIVWEYVNPFLSQSFEPYVPGTAINRGVYRCYRIPYEDAPKARLAIDPDKVPFRPGHHI